MSFKIFQRFVLLALLFCSSPAWGETYYHIGTLFNRTPLEVDFQFQWEGQAWESRTISPGKLRWVNWNATSAEETPSNCLVRFDADPGPDEDFKIYTLRLSPSKQLKGANGFPHYFLWDKDSKRIQLITDQRATQSK